MESTELGVSIKRLKDLFDKEKINWMVVSGTALFLYSHQKRELTDLDIVVETSNLYDVEALLRKHAWVDGLSAVRFVGNFGEATPLTPYLRMFINRLEVHLSSDWVYRLRDGLVVHIPFNKNSFQEARKLDYEGTKINVARPELIFLCKTITRRTYLKNSQASEKDLDDCRFLAKEVRPFDEELLKNLYTKTNLEPIWEQVALPIVRAYH